jgi:hypothetical protein
VLSIRFSAHWHFAGPAPERASQAARNEVRSRAGYRTPAPLIGAPPVGAAGAVALELPLLCVEEDEVGACVLEELEGLVTLEELGALELLEPLDELEPLDAVDVLELLEEPPHPLSATTDRPNVTAAARKVLIWPLIIGSRPFIAWTRHRLSRPGGLDRTLRLLRLYGSREAQLRHVLEL